MTEPAPVVGVLGGSFDPVHLGHLALADHARQRLGLQRMLLLPTAVPTTMGGCLYGCAGEVRNL